MTTAQAKRIILVAAVASGALASLQALAKGKTPDIRIAIGVIVVAVILLTLAEVQPQIAGMFGLLVLVSSIFAIGPDAWKSIQLVTKG